MLHCSMKPIVRSGVSKSNYFAADVFATANVPPPMSWSGSRPFPWLYFWLTAMKGSS
ncbi:hypothetical protein LMG28727_01429 [Paraburkholderia kirstenboschensis]|nr:hypothetical protein LMG28727_01429 [Paraburkholderia kirstenboschensis]